MAEFIPNEKWLTTLHPQVYANYRKRHPKPVPEGQVIELETAIFLQAVSDRQRLWEAKTFKEAIVILKDIVPFWTGHGRKKPFQHRAEHLLHCTRLFLPNYRRQYKGLPPVPTDWLGLVDWLTDAETVLAGGSHPCTLKVAVEQFKVSRATLMRAINSKTEPLKSYRPKGSAKSAPHIVDAVEVARRWGLRQ